MTSVSQDNVLEKTLKSARGVFGYVTVFSLCINLLMLTAPIYMMQVFNRVLTSRSVDTLVTLLFMAIVALLTYAVLETVRGILMGRMGAWIDERLSPYALKISLDKGRQGQASSQSLRDLATFRGFLTSSALFPLLDAPWMPVFLIVLMVLNLWVGVVATLGAVLLLAVAVANELGTREALKKASQASVEANTFIEVSSRNADVIHAMGMSGTVQSLWHKASKQAAEHSGRAGDRGMAFGSLSKFLRFVLQIVILSFAAWLVLDGDMSPGAMIAASILMGRALAPVEQAIGSWRQGVGARDAYMRLKEALANCIEEEEQPLPLPAPTGHMVVKGIGYIPPGREDPALNSVSFELKPGESLGVVGPVASGKSTLARMLIGNLKPKVGHVRLDGVEISEWDRQELGPHIGYMPQDVQLFPGTIAANIARLGDPDADAVVAAAKNAGAHERILALPGGYNCKVTENGLGLSGGQKQAVALARALYGNPKLVVLDEPNANVDGQGQDGLANAIEWLKASAITTVVISHRAHVMQGIDTIMVLQNGQIERIGPKEQILGDLLRSSQPPEKQPNIHPIGQEVSA